MVQPTKEELREWLFQLDDVINNTTQSRSDEEIVSATQGMLSKFWDRYEINYD